MSGDALERVKAGLQIYCCSYFYDDRQYPLDFDVDDVQALVAELEVARKLRATCDSLLKRWGDVGSDKSTFYVILSRALEAYEAARGKA